ncbi:YSIRK-type signal peptide-containing protein [Lactobacillus gigeriorum]|uniref:Mucus-binding protein n=1 Tax=Lactobacillus gigeriorum DSM 23908 = CRBIP 24.85 TaxID=1423751 RepID=I7LFC6_9LACO|nr:YSIRK-type signal peptide-containing protein [Lactobacillus gigeriorum]KRN14432.1 hypothetical protein FC38_GL001094 [Lactobacillus gigeriorum DSM 23908 = CRBIP 24.85]CCI86563.1 Mucus-binding protein [Lactobacillus gigeriorum DSM 23908 = CRBIP 24.85]
MDNKNRQEMQNRFSLRKLTIGLASVSLGMFFMQTSNQVKANTLPATTDTNKGPVQPTDNGSTDNGRQELATPAKIKAAKQTTTQGQIDPTDTTTPIAPSTTVPSYDGKKVVDTPFYNNPNLQGTNSKLIYNESKDGQYNIYFTAKDASGKEYASSYAAEKNEPKGVVLNSILDKDAGAYDPNSLEFHFYYQNNADKDQTINYTLRMPDYLNPYKAGRPESSLVPDGSRISDVKVTSKQGNTYDISSLTKTLDGVKSRDGDLRYVGEVPVNLTVKANDAIDLVIPFVLNTTAKKSTTTIDDHNEFMIFKNGQRTGYLVVRSSTYAPLYPEDKIYPMVNVGNNNYTHDYPDNPGALTLDPSVYRDEDFMNGFWEGNIYNYSTPTNKSTVYGSYTNSYLLLDKYEDYLTKHGFSVAFSNGKPVPYYMYQLSKTGSKVVDKNGNPVEGETKGHPYFEVVPVILLNQDETYTTKTAPTAWDPSTMVNKVADPTNYRYWDQKTDSAVRMDNTAAQLTAKDFTVTITKDGQAVKPDANGKYDLSKPGIYTVTYSRDFNGTTISNSGQITVTPVEKPNNPSDNNNNNSNNDNNGGNNSGAIVPINPSDNNSNNSNTAPTDNNTDTSKPTDNASKPTDEPDKKANNSRSQKESKSKTKATGIKNSSTDNNKPNNGKSIADPMTRQKENGLTGVAQAATTGVKAGQTNSDKLPQTGEKKGMLLSIIGLLAAALGIFGIAINRKKEN